MSGELKTILDEAAEITSGERRRAYGHPRDNHGCTAALWSAYILRRAQVALREAALPAVHDAAVLAVLPELLKLDGRDVCWLNVLQKASRDANMRKRDNLADTAGYVRNAEMLDEVGA